MIMAYILLILAILISALIFVGGLAWLQPGAHPDIKHALAGELSSLNTLVLFVAMLAGSLAKSLHTEFERPKSARVTKSLVRRALTNRSLFVALVVSPITFITVYRMAGVEPDRVVALLLSFQNGFFWKTMFEGARAGSE
jgi:hypothetical protein